MLCMWQEIDNKYEQCDSVGLWSGGESSLTPHVISIRTWHRE